MRKDNVREEIFQSAIELFARRGYFATTIRDIVEKAGVTQPMVYYYFGSKEELFTTCIKELFGGIIDSYEELDRELPLKDYLKKFFDVGKKIYMDSPEAALLVSNFVFSPDEYPRFPEAKKLLWKPANMMSEVIARAKKKGEVRKDVNELSISFSLMGALAMTKTLNFIHEKIEKLPYDKDIDFVNKQLLDLATKGLFKK